jgi:hypothetical protein
MVVVVKMITGRENKIVESIVRKPVQATSNFSPLLVCVKKLFTCSIT